MCKSEIILQPWYAKKAAEHPEEGKSVPDQEPKDALLALPAATPKEQEERESSKEKRRHKDNAKKKKDKDKKKDKHRKHKGSTASKSDNGDLFAALRAEREAREDLERKRANQAVLDATFNADG